MTQTDMPKSKQAWSVSNWRLAINTYVEQNEKNLQRVNETPPSWVRLIAGVLGFAASLLALALPGIALLIFDRLIPSGSAAAIWPMLGLGLGTLAAVTIVDMLRMQALGVYFSNARSLILYQDTCFAIFWALILAFIHPVLSLVPALAGLTLFLSWRTGKRRRTPIATSKTQAAPDILVASGLAEAYLKLAASGKIQSSGTLDFQSIGQASWLNFIQVAACLLTLAAGTALHISGLISLGTLVAVILMNQYLVSIFIRLFQISALQPPKAKDQISPFLPSSQARSKKAQPASDEDMKMLSIDALETPRIAPFSADLFQGLCLGVIGPSGSGKSALLHAIATGQFDEGKITYRDKNWGRNHAPLAPLAYAASPAIALPGSIVENITGFDPKASAKPPIELLRKLDPFDDVFQNTDLVNAPIDMDHVGQMQLVSLARAFWQESEILVLDHPETYLDKASRAGLMALILEAKTNGKIVLLATDDDYLMTLADELVKLERGEVTDRGPKEEVLSRHHQRWVRVSFLPTKREGFRLSLWLDAQFPRGMDPALKERVKNTAQDMLFFAPRDQLLSDQDEVLFDLRINPDEVSITMHDRGDLMSTDHLSADAANHYTRMLEQCDSFDQKLREGYRQLMVTFTDSEVAEPKAGQVAP